jgi:hypothetical protein
MPARASRDVDVSGRGSRRSHKVVSIQSTKFSPTCAYATPPALSTTAATCSAPSYGCDWPTESAPALCGFLRPRVVDRHSIEEVSAQEMPRRYDALMDATARAC